MNPYQVSFCYIVDDNLNNCWRLIFHYIVLTIVAVVNLTRTRVLSVTVVCSKVIVLAASPTQTVLPLGKYCQAHHCSL